MIIKRDALNRLEKWAVSDNRKPLVIRGARQVGKTTFVKEFAKTFDQFAYLNLDKNDDLSHFERELSLDQLINSVFLDKGITKSSPKILIFIDEIQNSAEAIKMLRYFYEDYPELYVIAAGSLLETVSDVKVSFPVGRVDYMFLHPISFREFLRAMDKHQLLEIYDKVVLEEYAYAQLLDLFHTYTLIGGMPEVVSRYAEIEDFVELNNIYNGLKLSYVEDVEKYAKRDKEKRVIQHFINTAPFESGKRIKFEGFGSSNYKSKDIKKAFSMLQKAMLLKLIYPSSSVKLPIQPDFAKSPKLQFLDTGLMNYFLGLQKSILGIKDLDSVYNGKIAEHIVGQELLINEDVNFWVREKKQSSAEVDYILQYEKYIIPIEVKSGASGRLRSIHQFINRTEHDFAIRLYSGELSFNDLKTIEGKNFRLLNLPYSLAGKVREYIQHFI